jgi:exosome complex component RRP45
MKEVHCTFLNYLEVILTVSLCIFSEHVVADPTAIEERVSAAQIVFGMNAYRELCGLHLGGSSLTSPDLILQCANRAAKRAAEVVQIMKSALKEDADARYGELHSY